MPTLEGWLPVKLAGKGDLPNITLDPVSSAHAQSLDSAPTPAAADEHTAGPNGLKLSYRISQPSKRK
jgi:hypothetical protein